MYPMLSTSNYYKIKTQQEIEKKEVEKKMLFVTIDFDALWNGKLFPEYKETGVLYYEIVFKHSCGPYMAGSHEIARIPFNRQYHSGKHTYRFYAQNERIDDDISMTSVMKPHVFLYNALPLTIHFRKLTRYKTKGPIGVDFNIEESFSRYEDRIMLKVSDASDSVDWCSVMNMYRPKYNGSELFRVEHTVWRAQREFYRKILCNTVDALHYRTLGYICKFLENADLYKTLTLFVKAFLTFIHQAYELEYESDHFFSENNPSRDENIPLQHGMVPERDSAADQGCPFIEMSIYGDCEDFNHFYIRCLRTLAQHGALLAPEHVNHEWVSMLSDHYMPCVYICDITQPSESTSVHRGSTNLEFHSTMILLPIQQGYDLISVEVTNIELSMNVHKNEKEFFSWHRNHYALETPFWYSYFNECSNMHDLNHWNAQHMKWNLF